MPAKYASPLWHPTIKSAAGTYVGHYAGGTETFHLYSNGRFDQTLVKFKKAVYANSGGAVSNWTFANDEPVLNFTDKFRV